MNSERPKIGKGPKLDLIECELCKDSIEDFDEEDVAVLNKCKHMFHMECMLKYIKEKKDESEQKDGVLICCP